MAHEKLRAELENHLACEKRVAVLKVELATQEDRLKALTFDLGRSVRSTGQPIYYAGRRYTFNDGTLKIERMDGLVLDPPTGGPINNAHPTPTTTQ